MERICSYCNCNKTELNRALCEECRDMFDQEEAEYYKFLERNKRKELKR